jgi:hypothetical protein
MINDAITIIVHVYESIPGMRVYGFEWEGPPDGTIVMSNELYNVSHQLFEDLFPWKLTHIGHDVHAGCHMFRRREFV